MLYNFLVTVKAAPHQCVIRNGLHVPKAWLKTENEAWFYSKVTDNTEFRHILSDFINLTQVHNFTVSAQDIFTFRRLSVFTVSFTGILQVLMR